jgi:hypothetical protein
MKKLARMFEKFHTIVNKFLSDGKPFAPKETKW